MYRRRKTFNGEALRALRKDAGLTQEDLAFKVGLSRETVSAIENNKPGTIDSIGLEVLDKWHRICLSMQGRESADSNFMDEVFRYFGFSK